MNEITPLNALEKGIQDARERRLGTRDLMRLLLASNLAVPSSTPVTGAASGRITDALSVQPLRPATRLYDLRLRR